MCFYFLNGALKLTGAISISDTNNRYMYMQNMGAATWVQVRLFSRELTIFVCV